MAVEYGGAVAARNARRAATPLDLLTREAFRPPLTSGYRLTYVLLSSFDTATPALPLVRTMIQTTDLEPLVWIKLLERSSATVRG